MSRPEKIVNEIVAKMQECGLGMRRKTVELSEHNNHWAPAFSWLKSKIQDRLGDTCSYQVEHFGSTSIPGIGAKPALDVMVIFTSMPELQAAIPSFEKLGFIYKGDAIGKLNQTALEPDRHFFSFYDLDESIDYIHLHVFVNGHPDVARNLGFRDILRANPSLAHEYAQIKHQLKVQGLSRQDYTRTKSTFISRVVSKMENKQLTIDTSLVHRLVTEQFPQWTHLPIRPVATSGWDNRTFHLGDDMLVRMPSAECYAAQVEKEHRWLPKLAPGLPLPIPTPIAIGAPGFDYPWRWSVYRWLKGETAAAGQVNDMKGFARSLGQFLTALQRISADGGPLAGAHNFHRGGSLKVYDEQTREAILKLKGKINEEVVIEIWDTALSSIWQHPSVWVHGDVSTGNLLVQEGQLSAVIDFGILGVGDPACDLVIAWTFFRGESREAFKAALPLDADTWARGRGWALWKALIVVADLPGTDPGAAESSWQTLNEIIADHEGNTVTTNKPWAADIEIDARLATALIQEQFALVVHSITEMEAGWDNQPFLVNDELVFRFPRRKVAVELLERESKVLPYIAPRLPAAIPCPIYIGKPSRDYPHPFHGYKWIPGTSANKAVVVDGKLPILATELGSFVKSLHCIELPVDLRNILPLGDENGARGSFKDCFHRIWEIFDNVVSLKLIPDEKAIGHLLEQANVVATCDKAHECVVHGDLYFAHLLLEDGQLSGVIDWGDMHIGDPANDLAIAFQYFPASARPSFFQWYGPSSNDLLLRARLWAAYSSVILIWYGHHNNKQDLVERGLLGCKNVLE